MKASSCPNLNRETTSFPNFFTLFQDPADHDHDTTLNKRPKIDHGDDTTLNKSPKSNDTETSVTSPFKGILSTSLSVNEMNENHYRIVGFFPEWDAKGQTQPKAPPSPNGSDTSVSVGSNQFSGGDGGARQLWVKNLSKAWWGPDLPEDEFRRLFKMSKSTFDLICDELHPWWDQDRMLRLVTGLRSDIPVRQTVAVCIWHLATGDPLRLVSKRFGLGIFTCQKLVLEVCEAITAVLSSKYLNWPDEEKMEGIKREFELVSGIPNVAGSMYTTRVPVIAPKENGPAYFNKSHPEKNRETSYSITVQGVVDCKGFFTAVCIGWPGSMTDDEILEKSEISQCANRGLLKDVWIVGNAGYPLMDWVLVPYTCKNLTWTQHVFNEKAGEVKRVAKEAFSRWKGRWSCLQKRTEVKPQDMPVVLGACCVLHNICEAMDPSNTSVDLLDDVIVPENRARSVDAMRARDQIAHRLLHHNFAGTSFL